MPEPREPTPTATPTSGAVITLSGDTIPISIDLTGVPPVQPTGIEGYTASPDHQEFFAPARVHQVGCSAELTVDSLISCYRMETTEEAVKMLKTDQQPQ